MSGRRRDRRRIGRRLRERAAAAALLVVGLLVFTWPFVRTPALGLGASYLHLLGWWAVSIVALALMARVLDRRRRGDGDRDA